MEAPRRGLTALSRLYGYCLFSSTFYSHATITLMTASRGPHESDSLAIDRSTGRWSQNRRLEFIDFRLRWDGRLNRSDLTDFFGISVPQASLDIAKYLERAPGNLDYDRSSKVYLANESFQPLFSSSDVSRYLNDLLARASGLEAGDSSFLAWAPPVATVPSPGRTFSVEVLAALLRAIREGLALKVVYQSMTRTQPSARTLSPHAVAHDGFRWHARAYCHSRKQFRDFVIARMLKVEGFDSAAAKPEDDREWSNIVPLVLAPHPKLSESHRRAIELDYGMQQGKVEFHCRQAFLFYALRHLRLDAESLAKPEAQQIVLANRTVVDKYRQAASAQLGA